MGRFVYRNDPLCYSFPHPIPHGSADHSTLLCPSVRMVFEIFTSTQSSGPLYFLFQNTQLFNLTALFLTNCKCRACFPNPFYTALFTTPGLALRDVWLKYGKGLLPDISGACSVEMVDVLGIVHWPQLRRISIAGLDCYHYVFDGSDADALRSRLDAALRTFLIRHTLLEAVALLEYHLPYLPEDALPNLRSLRFDWRVIFDNVPTLEDTTYRLPQNIAKNIYHFQPRITGDEMLDVLKDMKELKSCSIVREVDLAKLYEYAPKLERLWWHLPSRENVTFWGVNNWSLSY